MVIVLHDVNGLVTGVQVFPETTDAMHIVVDDSFFEPLQELMAGQCCLELVNGVFILPPDIDAQLQALSLNKFRAEKINQIEKSQATELTAGVPFSFNGTSDLVQTRSERDLININGVVTQAMLLKNANVFEPAIRFRAQSNCSFMLTPDDAIALGVAVAQHSQQVYEKAWQLKDAAYAAQTVEELELLQW